jgi:hypothetical protein
VGEEKRYELQGNEGRRIAFHSLAFILLPYFSPGWRQILAHCLIHGEILETMGTGETLGITPRWCF